MPQENLNKIWKAGKLFEEPNPEQPTKEPIPDETKPSNVKRRINVAKAFVPQQEDPFKKKVEAVLKGIEPEPTKEEKKVSLTSEEENMIEMAKEIQKYGPSKYEYAAKLCIASGDKVEMIEMAKKMQEYGPPGYKYAAKLCIASGNEIEMVEMAKKMRTYGLPGYEYATQLCIASGDKVEMIEMAKKMQEYGPPGYKYATELSLASKMP